MKHLLLFVAIVFLLLFTMDKSHAQTFQSGKWITDGSVTTMATWGNTVYLGGTFEYVGPLTSENGAALDLIYGVANPAFPSISGNSVDVAVPDGVGGWYIGGAFSMVGTEPRNNVARINADGSVNSWNPDVDAAVYAMVLSEGKVYLGGDFETVGATPRNFLAAVDANTGAVDPSWDPNPDGTVEHVAVSSTHVFASGAFENIGTTVAAGLAKIDRVTGEATTGFPAPSDASSIYALALNGGTLFVGGYFTTLGGVSRQRLASINLASGTVTDWGPEPNNTVAALLVHGSSLYVGGDFNFIAGQIRYFCAEFMIGDGALTDWSTSGYNGFANGSEAIAFANGAVYLGGSLFANDPGIAHLAAFDSTTGALTSWYPATPLNLTVPSSIESRILTVAVSGSQIYVGGSFVSIGGKRRRLLAAVDATTGAALGWRPDPGKLVGSIGFPATINSLATKGSTVFVGGDFNIIGGSPNRTNIAAVDGTTGNATSWHADANNTVRQIVVSGNTLYVAGDFDTVAAVRRYNLAALDATTGGVSSWNPTTSPTQIERLAVGGNTVFVAGSFTTIASVPRHFLASIDATTAAVTSWDPNPTPYAPTSLVVDGNTLFVGGIFSNIGGQARNRLAAFNATTGALTGWNPDVGGRVFSSVNAILPTGTAVYIGGSFGSVGGQPRTGLALVDRSTGSVSPFNSVLATSSGADPVVNAIVSVNINLFTGGWFDSVGVDGSQNPLVANLQLHPNLIAFLDNALPIQLAIFTASLNQQHQVVLNWTTVSETNNYGFYIQKRRENETAWFEIPNSFIPGHGTTVEPHHYTFTDTNTLAGRWQYRLKQVDLDGSVNLTEPVTIDVVTDVAENSIPVQFELQQNYPNPFNPTTQIKFAIPTGIESLNRTSLKIYNMLGQEVATLVNESLKPGYYEATLDAKNLASGVYFYRLQSGAFSETKRMLLMK